MVASNERVPILFSLVVAIIYRTKMAAVNGVATIGAMEPAEILSLVVYYRRNVSTTCVLTIKI